MLQTPVSAEVGDQTTTVYDIVLTQSLGYLGSIFCDIKSIDANVDLPYFLL